MQLNAIKKMERIARNGTGVISLAQGIPANASHDYIRKKASQAMLSGKADAYSDPQGIYELRQELSSHLKGQGMVYSPSEIIVTSGAIEALGTALRCAVTKERPEVIVPTPVYSAYFKLIELAGGMAVEVPLDEAAAWSLNSERITERMTPRTAAVLLCNPNNPTGTVYDQTLLDVVAGAAMTNGCMLIIDEVYRNMVYDGKEFYSPATNPAFKEAVVRVMGFSKDFSLTGWRVGYMHASSSRIPALLGIHDTVVNCAPVVSQYAALAALEIHGHVIAENRAFYERQRNKVAAALKKVNMMNADVRPAGAYFFFPRITTGETSSGFALRILQETGVALVPGEAFGTGGERHVRLCFGRDEQTVDEALARLQAAGSSGDGDA